MTSPTKPDLQKRFALSSKEDRATAIGNMFRKFREIWTNGFEIFERTDKQTGKQTLITVLISPKFHQIIFCTCYRWPWLGSL